MACRAVVESAVKRADQLADTVEPHGMDIVTKISDLIHRGLRNAAQRRAGDNYQRAHRQTLGFNRSCLSVTPKSVCDPRLPRSLNRSCWSVSWRSSTISGSCAADTIGAESLGRRHLT